MKVIIEEPRSKFWSQKANNNMVKGIIGSRYPITEIVVRDVFNRKTVTLAEIYGTTTRIPIKKFPEEKEKYGKEASLNQTYEMTRYADALIAIWDGERQDIKETIKFMNRLDKPVFLYLIDKEEE